MHIKVLIWKIYLVLYCIVYLLAIHCGTKSYGYKVFSRTNTRRIQETQKIAGNKTKSVVQKHTDTMCFPELNKRIIQEIRKITGNKAKAHCVYYLFVRQNSKCATKIERENLV